MESIKFIFEGVILSIVGCLGIFGNAAAIAYFGHNKRRRQTFYGLMLVLAIVDLLLIVTCFFIFSLPQFSSTYKSSSVWHYTVMWVLPVAQICFTGNTYLTVAVSVERYLAICRPFFHRARSWSTQYFGIPILSFSILYNVPKFFELKWSPNESTAQNETNSSSEISHHVIPTDLRTDPIYFQIYFVWANFIINGIIPFVLLITLNILILNQLRIYSNTSNSIKRNKTTSEISQPRIHQHGVDERRQAQVHMAKVSIIIVAIFVTCHSVKWVPNIYEMIFVSSFSAIARIYPIYCFDIYKIKKLCLVRLLSSIASCIIYYRDSTVKMIMDGQYG